MLFWFICMQYSVTGKPDVGHFSSTYRFQGYKILLVFSNNFIEKQFNQIKILRINSLKCLKSISSPKFASLVNLCRYCCYLLPRFWNISVLPNRVLTTTWKGNIVFFFNSLRGSMFLLNFRKLFGYLKVYYLSLNDWYLKIEAYLSRSNSPWPMKSIVCSGCF